MLIHITIDKQKLSAIKTQILSRFICRIVEIITRGHHKVIAERHCCAFLETASTTDQQKYLFKKLYNEYATSKGLLYNAKFNIEISEINDFFEISGSTRRIGISNFLTLGFVGSPILLVEHEANDGDYVETLTRYAARGKIPFHTLEISHAGGDDMPKIAETKLAKNKIVACIADSDKKYPDAPMSAKSLKLATLAVAHGNSLFIAKELPCHEIENTIPLNCLDKLHLSASQKSTLRELERIENIELNSNIPLERRFRLFFDYKSGLSKEIYADMPDSVSNYIDSIVNLCALNLNKKTLSSFGGKLTQQIKAKPECQSELHSNLKNCPYWINLFESIFLFIAYFFASDPPLVSY